MKAAIVLLCIWIIVPLQAQQKPTPLGVAVYDREKAQPGYNLYNDHSQNFYLVDMDGNIERQWYHPSSGKFNYAVLTGDGTLIALGRNKVAILDWDSNELYFERVNIHHDIAFLEEGSFLTLGKEKIKYNERFVLFDTIVKANLLGEIEKLWSSFDALSQLQLYHPLTHHDDADIEPYIRNRDDYYHTNAIKILPDNPLAKSDPRFSAGNILISGRNVSTLFILDRQTLDVVWGWGNGVLDWQHSSLMLDDGAILVYDNGMHRGYSRVVKVDPIERTIIWEYVADPPESFHSITMGGCQELDNGNVLITDAHAARAFEVTPDKEIVWEFFHPEYYNETFTAVENKALFLYKMERYSEKFIDAIKNSY